MLRHRGYTLVELLVVLAVLALSSVVVFSAVRPSPRVELRTAAADVAAALRLARNRAYAQGRSAALEIDLEDRSFAVNGETKRRRLSPRLQVSLYTARSELSGKSGGAIRFFPDGTSTGGRITLRVPGGGAFGVDVDWLTSRVRILEGTGT